MIRTAVQTLWAEPRAPHAPVRVWRDWVLVSVLVCTALLESLLRKDVPWAPLGVIEAVALAFTLLWRRTHPLAMVAVAFGTATAIDVATIVGGERGAVSSYTMAFVLLLPYALFRWGSGREAILGSAILLVSVGVGLLRDQTPLSEAIIGFVFMSVPAVLGASVRIWTTSHARELDQVRLREREQLARELHDTVAHHVSAMVIRAQAGRVVEATRPGAAAEALEIIETEGSRTLAEMRTMVGALRDTEEAELAPQGGVADIERLARLSGDAPRVEVHMTGDLEGLRPSVGAAAYRIAQESITNAMRHARHASRIDVLVAGDADCVRLTVRDDGDAVSGGRSPSGFGLVGMRERAMLLGGTLEAGPGPSKGWLVDAVLPRAGSAG